MDGYPILYSLARVVHNSLIFWAPKIKELEEEKGQKETPENVNGAEEASIDLKEIAERAIEIVNLKWKREKSKEKA